MSRPGISPSLSSDPGGERFIALNCMANAVFQFQDGLKMRMSWCLARPQISLCVRYLGLG